MTHKIQSFVLALLAVAGATLAAENQKDLIAILQSGMPPEQAIACKKLAIYGHKEAVPVLAPLLADTHLASWARIALEVIPGPEADAALRDAQAQLHGRLLIGVINSLAVRRDAKAVPALAGRLKDPDPEVAGAAACALGRIGGGEATQILTQTLPTAPAGVRSDVAEGCILCAEQLTASGKASDAVKLYETIRTTDLPKQRILEATRGVILAKGADGIPLLLEQLHSEDKATFGIALRIARELPGPSVTEALVAELDRARPERQAGVLCAIADRGGAAAVPVVAKAARSGAKSLRLVAIGVLEKLGTGATVPVLLELVTDSEADIAQAGKGALGRMLDKSVDVALAARLPQATGPARRVLIELAGERRTTEAAPELLKAASDSDAAIRAAALKALAGTAGLTEVGPLTDLLVKSKSAADSSAVSDSLETILARLPEKAACADKLLACLPQASSGAKCALLPLLGQVGGAPALAAVRTATSDSNADIREAALRALCEWQNPEALSDLAKLTKTTTNPKFKVLALRGYIHLIDQQEASPENKLPLLKEAMAMAEQNREKSLVLGALGNVASAEALVMAIEALKIAELKEEACLAAVGVAEKIVKSHQPQVTAAMQQVVKATKDNQVLKRARALLAQGKKAAGAK